MVEPKPEPPKAEPALLFVADEVEPKPVEPKAEVPGVALDVEPKGFAAPNGDVLAADEPKPLWPNADAPPND